jgi:hypothetical protein
MTSDDKKIKPKPAPKNDDPPKEKGVQEAHPSQGAVRKRPTHPLAIVEAKAKAGV